MDIKRVILIGILISCVACESEDSSEEEGGDESTEHYVDVIVYMLPLPDWNEGNYETFKNAIAATANSYCANNARLCYLEDNWTDGGSFEEEDVSVSAEHLTYKKPYLKTRFSLSLPTGVVNKVEFFNEDAPTKFFVHGTILEDITIHAIDLFANKSGYHIIGVNDAEFSIPPDNMMNMVMTIVAFLILGLCLAIGALLNWKCGGEPERVEPDDDDDEEEAKTSKKPIVEMEAVGFSRPSGMEAAAMLKSAQKPANGNNETKT